MGHDDPKANRLARTSSPYLLQHAYNPVDWFPWGDEALEKARREDRPIFLSIGYSTCHWCHVMERESFEDDTVARMMNESFVSIKVDREERPDLDAVYMKACTLATGRGGWPLTVIMTPNLEPFFLGTYIPKRARWGSPGMMDLIAHIKDLWRNDREQVLSASSQIAEALGSLRSGGPGEDLGVEIIEKASDIFKRTFDHENGGFGSAPKFPSPHNGMLLLRYWKRTNDGKALDMVKATLDHMIRGGINDHVGGGFHRYSTDAEWRVPHFEKMLYDQAMISMLLLEAYQITKEERYAEAVRSTLDYVIRDLSDPSGGFHSAEDADSEGEEGMFYVWSYAELKSILTDGEFALLRSAFDVRDEGNFRDEATGKGTKRNILFLGSNIPGMEKERMGSILRKLKSFRDERVRPSKDDKVLADWNGMMISALAKASRVLKDPSYAARATKAASFILGSMRGPDGGLLHRYRNGEAAIDGFLEDYAYVIQGLLDLYGSTLDPGLLKEALTLDRIVLDNFRDEENGGFFQTSVNAEKVLIRNKDCYDGAIPSGNSVQMMNLLRLFRITGDPRSEEEAHRIAMAFSGDVERAPTAFSYLLCALDMAIGPSTDIKIAGDRHNPNAKEMIDIVNSRFDPNAILLRIDGDGLKGIVPDLEDYPAVDGKATAYVCSGNRCAIPTGDPEKLKEQI